MAGKKALFLFLGLLLPILVFLFLKMFGKNEFDVPLLYDKGVQAKPAGCDFNYPTPYVLADSVVGEITTSKAPLILVNFSAPSASLNHIAGSFKDEVTLINEGEIKLSPQRLNFIKRCVLLTEISQVIVLIDDKKRIRGYYDPTDRDELDRLEAEMNIILKKY
jgi:hypothetical protein